MQQSKYEICKDKNRISPEAVARLLDQSYWAKGRSVQCCAQSMEHSLCFGAFDTETGELVGFARAFTDYATAYYLCDVIVDEKHRGKGIGKLLVEAVTTDECLNSLSGMLLTKNAEKLYAQYGFVTIQDTNFMRRKLNM